MNSTLPCLLKSAEPWRKLPRFIQIDTETINTSPTDDIVNSRVREIILSNPKTALYLDPTKSKQLQKQHSEQVKTNQQFMKQFDERKWLTRKGKKYLIDFDNSQRRQMKQYFNSLDRKGCGSIGIDELEELLLSVGLMETREEIKSLIDSVDEDKSGKIQFGQFLSMIQNDEGQNQQIVSFFKTVIGDKLKNNTVKNLQRRGYNHPKPKMPKSGVSDILNRYPYPKGLSFQMVVSHIRRKHMMTALNINRKDMVQSGYDTTVQRVAKGQRVMQALQRMYQRKLVMQIKESKRSSNLSRTENIGSKRAHSQPWFNCRQTN